VLVDMPGLNDWNIFRERATKAYLSRCHHICITVEADDCDLHKKHTRDLVKENLIGHPANQISLIITHLDKRIPDQRAVRRHRSQAVDSVTQIRPELIAHQVEVEVRTKTRR